MKVCSVEGCGRTSENYPIYFVKKGNNFFCKKHQIQLLRHGKIYRTKYEPNEIILKNKYAEIIMYDLRGNEVARTKVSLCDLDKLKKHKWSLANGYASTHINFKRLTIHQFLFDTKGQYYCIDHRNRDKLDNRRENLIQTSKSENTFNQKISTRNTSGVVGVTWHKSANKWMSSITLNHKKIYLGLFKNFEDAVNARKKAELKYFGEIIKR